MAAVTVKRLLLTGVKRTNALSDVRYWPKADMNQCTAHVRFQR